MSADVIVGLSFGIEFKNDKYVPGITNECIAQIIKKQSTPSSIPVIAQWPVVEALSQKGILVFENIEGFISTGQVIEEVARKMQQQEWHNAIVVTHPHLIRRALSCFKKLGINATPAPNLDSIPYNRNSKHWWNRRRFYWFFWNMIDWTYSKAVGWV